MQNKLRAPQVQYEALPRFYSMFIAGAIPELLNVVWMVVVMLLVVAMPDLFCPVI